mgnify:CR=1 FL=1
MKVLVPNSYYKTVYDINYDKLLEYRKNIQSITIMIQKEVALMLK